MARNKIEYSIEVRDRASNSLRSISNETNALGNSFGKLGAIVAGVFSGREILQYADTWRLLQNRMRLVTESTEELNAVTSELITLSLRSRTGFESTANLYARVARSSRELNLSQKELLTFTETVSKSIRISGSTAAEASAGVIQFGQALASSRLSGDELRSVLEQMPRLAQAIAEGMGVGIGQLREMGEAGTLSANKVLEALEKAEFDIAREFSNLDPLVSEALGNISTAFISVVGQIDAFIGASKAAAEGMVDFAEQMVIFGQAVTGNLVGQKELTNEQRIWLKEVKASIASGKGLESVLRQSTEDTAALAKGLGITIDELIGLEGATSDVVDAYDLSIGATQDYLTETGKVGRITEGLASIWIIAGAALSEFILRMKLVGSSFESYGKGLVDFNDMFAEFARTVVTSPVEKGMFDEMFAIGKEAWAQLTTDVRADHFETAAEVEAIWISAWDRITALRMPDLRPPPTIDLDVKDPNAAEIISRLQREAIARGQKILDKYVLSVNQYHRATKLAEELSIDFADALTLIKVQAAAVIAESPELGNALINMLQDQFISEDITEAQIALSKLKEEQDNQIAAMKISAAIGLNYADALDEVETAAIGAAAGQEELAKRIIDTNRQLSADDLLDALNERLEIVKMTERAQFIYNQTVAKGIILSEEELIALQNVAGQIFDLMEEARKQQDFMADVSEQTAKSIFSAWEDFWFDPFDEGMKGMVLSFLEAIRRMLAAQIAFQTLSNFDFFSGITGGGDPGFAGSGPLSPRAAGGFASGFTILGERGPELVNLPRGSRVTPNSALRGMGMGEVKFESNIDARGADMALIARLPMILDQRDKRLMLAVQRYHETGTLEI